MTADLLLCAWALLWGVLFHATGTTRRNWFDGAAALALLSLIVFPVLAVWVARNLP